MTTYGRANYMKSSKQHDNLLLAVKVTIIIIICLLYSLKSNGVTIDIFSVPLNYINSSDEYNWYLALLNYFETGNVLENPRLGAPFVSELYDFPMFLTFKFDLFVLRFILFFYPNVFIALNLYYVLLPAFIGTTAFFALRSLNTPDWINMGGAVTYAFLPFYYMRALSHFALTTYQFVPLAFLLCVWGYKRKIFISFRKTELTKNYRNWMAVCFCILIANNGNGYWQAFSCFFLLATGLLALYDTGKWKSAVSCFIPLALITLFFAVALYPSVRYQVERGRNPEAVKRLIFESDIYGLKITQMLLPYEIPGNNRLETNFKHYLKEAPLTNENQTAYLGVVGSFGFVLLLSRLLLKRKELKQTNSDMLLDLFARLNICALLLAIIGGFGTVFSVFTAPGILLRGYNRISVYIAFLSIATVCLCAQKLIENKDGQKLRLCQTGLFFLLLTHFVCLYSWFHFCPNYSALRTKYQSDKQFVAGIEDILPEAAMVYQLPYHKFPEAGPVNLLLDYQLFTGVLHSKSLKWSYGGMKGREGDAWHSWVNSLQFSKRVKILSLVGFQGIYIDRRAYKQQELKELEKELSDCLKVIPIVSKDKNLAFYSMKAYNESYLTKYTEEELQCLRQIFLSSKIKINGISYIEKDARGMTWQWMDKIVLVSFENQGKPYNREVQLNIAAGVSADANLIVNINGNETSYRISNKPTPVIVVAHFKHGINTIELRTDAAKVYAPNDGRSMYIRMINCDTIGNAILPSLK